jgi:hypothetical protein
MSASWPGTTTSAATGQLECLAGVRDLQAAGAQFERNLVARPSFKIAVESLARCRLVARCAAFDIIIDHRERTVDPLIVGSGVLN